MRRDAPGSLRRVAGRPSLLSSPSSSFSGYLPSFSSGATAPLAGPLGLPDFASSVPVDRENDASPLGPRAGSPASDRPWGLNTAVRTAPRTPRPRAHIPVIDPSPPLLRSRRAPVLSGARRGRVEGAAHRGQTRARLGVASVYFGVPLRYHSRGLPRHGEGPNPAVFRTLGRAWRGSASSVGVADSGLARRISALEHLWNSRGVLPEKGEQVGRDSHAVVALCGGCGQRCRTEVVLPASPPMPLIAPPRSFHLNSLSYKGIELEAVAFSTIRPSPYED